MSYPFLSDLQATQAFVVGRSTGDSPSAAWSYRLVEALSDKAAAMAGPFRRAADAVARYRRRHRAIADLMGLDDRLLRDIGVQREDIPALVRQVESRQSGSSAARPERPAERAPAKSEPVDELRLAA
jgi:uncharacterized protein YjiS (DUF1127 family)